jgi:hypothetical protein
MSDTIDLFLDTVDGIFPSFIAFLKSQNYFKFYQKYKKFINILIIFLKLYFVIHTIFVIYRIKFVDQGKYYKIDIRVKAITSIISLILLISPLISSYDSLTN